MANWIFTSSVSTGVVYLENTPNASTKSKLRASIF